MADWFHGSPLRLEVLRAGSTITPDRRVARLFSHKPNLVAHDNTGRVFHTGDRPGFLYRVEGVTDADIYPHPRTTMEPGIEWLTTRELTLVFLEETSVRAEELLDPAEAQRLRSRAGGRVKSEPDVPPIG
jgi:hypothetical protein